MAVDMWALGVCVYALISGYLPFDEMEPPEPGCTIEWVVEFPDEQWVDVSEDAKDLIRRLLEPNPMRRYTARQVLQHPVRVCVFVRVCTKVCSLVVAFVSQTFVTYDIYFSTDTPLKSQSICA